MDGHVLTLVRQTAPDPNEGEIRQALEDFRDRRARENNFLDSSGASEASEQFGMAATADAATVANGSSSLSLDGVEAWIREQVQAR